MAESNLTVYFDPNYARSKAVVTFCLLNNIPYKDIPLNMNQGEHLKLEYKTLCPLRTVPLIDDNGVLLSEYTAILRYLARTRKTPSHWYPEEDPKNAALIDAYLDWHLCNAKIMGAAVLLNSKTDRVGAKSYKDIKAEKVWEKLVKILGAIEHIWLKKEKYIAGVEEVSIADLSAYFPMQHLVVVEYDLSSYPKIKAWMKKVYEKIPKGAAKEIMQLQHSH